VAEVPYDWKTEVLAKFDAIGEIVFEPLVLDELPATINAELLRRQAEFSERTFGPGRRTVGISNHIRKELDEIAADPEDLKEWIDVAILAFDGAWRTGVEPQEIIDAFIAKLERNEVRTWPDWRTMSEDQAIEHVRDDEENP
jgi:hypothetical protein